MIVWCLLLVIAVSASPVGAQDAVLRARERAQMLTEFRAMLEHTDASTRMAAFEEAMASKDNALIALAMDAAFGGSDANLKTAALRAYLNGRKSLPVTVILPDRASDGVTAYFNTWNALSLNNLVVSGNEISGVYLSNRYPFGGQLISGGIDARLHSYDRCALVVKLTGAKQMSGSLDCALEVNQARRHGISRAVYPVRIDLP